MFLNGLDWYLNINKYICKVLHKARINSDLLIVKYCKILKYTNPSPYYLCLIICPMYSYVLYYNIENPALMRFLHISCK